MKGWFGSVKICGSVDHLSYLVQMSTKSCLVCALKVEADYAIEEAGRKPRLWLKVYLEILKQVDAVGGLDMGVDDHGHLGQRLGAYLACVDHGLYHVTGVRRQVLDGHFAGRHFHFAGGAIL
jgi:hypothetical protein